MAVLFKKIGRKLLRREPFDDKEGHLKKNPQKDIRSKSASKEDGEIQRKAILINHFVRQKKKISGLARRLNSKARLDGVGRSQEKTTESWGSAGEARFVSENVEGAAGGLKKRKDDDKGERRPRENFHSRSGWKPRATGDKIGEGWRGNRREGAGFSRERP